MLGYFDVYLNTDDATIQIVPNRGVALTLNAVNFFNNNPLKLGTSNLVITQSSPPGQFVDVDINLTLQHPFPGVPKFNGYDLELVFISTGSGTMSYNENLIYPVNGEDPILLVDPVNSDGGGPDGYTRWFNPTEFTAGGLLGYVEGKVSTKNFIGDATLNGYKLFADGIYPQGDAYTFVSTEDGPGNNVFASGNNPVTRNMFIRFPFGTAPLIKYNYAMVASWDGTKYPDPVNATEVTAAEINVTPGLYWVDGTQHGGDLILDISLAGYGSQPSTIILESTVLSSPYTLDQDEMVPVDTGETYATYHVEILNVDSLNSPDDNELWVIAEYGGDDLKKYGYRNNYYAFNLAWDDHLAAFFRFDLEVSPIPINQIPILDFTVVTPMPVIGLEPLHVEFEAYGSYDPDGSIVSYEWDFNNDLVYGDAYNEGTDVNPIYYYMADYNDFVNLKITDDQGAVSVGTSSIALDITTTQCGFTLLPTTTQPITGTANPNLAGTEHTRNDPVNRVITAASLSPTSFGFTTISPDGGSATVGFTSNLPVNNWPRDLAVDSSDRVYFYDLDTSTQLYYCQWNFNTLTFTFMRTPFGPPLSAGIYIWRIAVDEMNNPIILARGPAINNLTIYHWDPISSWGPGLTVPSSIISANGNNYQNFTDFDYNPYTEHYLLTDSYGYPGLYGINSIGQVAWSDPDVFNSISGAFNAQSGIYISKENPDCQMMFIAGKGISFTPGYFARFNASYGEKAVSLTSSISNNISDGRGCIVEDNTIGNFYYMGAAYGGSGNWWGRVLVPQWAI